MAETHPPIQCMYETISPESTVSIEELREATFGDTLVNIAKNPQSH